MTCNPHPTHMIAVAEQRHAEFRAEAERYPLANLGQDDVDRRRPSFDLLAVAAVALTLLAAGAAATQDGSPQTQLEHEQAAQAPTDDDPATIAVQKVREAAS